METLMMRAATHGAAGAAAGLRQRAQTAALPCVAPRRASRSRRAAARAGFGGKLGFHEEGASDAPAAPRAPGPSGLYGLSAQQMELLGLTGDEVSRRVAVAEAGVSARAAYAKEIPSMSSPPPRMVTAMSMGGGGGAPGQAPPDLPSLLLNARICYLGMPLVPAVTELIVAQLLWLNFDQPEKPVYFYLNSTGSQTPEGQAVGFETEAYAIMDTMQYVRPDIHTVCIGKAYGNAAMLLASGKKGCRYALPNSSIMLCPPRMNRKVDSATNLMISANDLEDNTTTYVDYLAEYTGKDKAVLFKDISRTRYFTPQQAIEYGLVDKVVNPQSGLLAEKRDYEAMLKMANAQQGGGRPMANAGRGGD